MNALNKLIGNNFLIAFVMNLVIIGNLIIWSAGLSTALISSLIIFTLVALIITGLVSIKKNYLLIIFLAFSLLMTLGLGTTEWDARSIWLAHAKVIYLDQNLYAQFNEGGYIGSHVDYPPGFPALAASFANMIGTWNEVFPKASIIFFLIPPLLLIFQVIRNKILEIIFLIGLGIICRNYLFNGYMDALVALYTCAIILFVMHMNISEHVFLEKKLSNYILPVIKLTSFFCILLVLKNEGLAISAVLIAVLFFCRQPFSFTQILLLTILSLSFYLLIWKYFLWDYGISNDLISNGLFDRVFQRINSFENIKLIFSYFFRYLDLFSLAFILNFFRKNIYIRDFKLPIIFIISYSAILFLLYLSTPSDLNWHLFTSIKRALLPILLVMLGSIIFSFCPAYTDYLEKK